MKVDLAALRSCVNHLFPIFFLLSLCKKKKPQMRLVCALSRPMVYGMMLVKANIRNDKETGNSKKDSVK